MNPIKLRKYKAPVLSQGCDTIFSINKKYLLSGFELKKPRLKSIAIVGGGASATLLIAQLSHQIKATNTPIDIYIFEPTETLSRGLAYSVNHPAFLLNVPANRMGAYAEHPSGFYDWLKTYPKFWRNLHSSFLDIDLNEHSFMPRMVYAEYLRWVFSAAQELAFAKNIRFIHIKHIVNRVTPLSLEKKLEIHSSLGEPIVVDIVIMATGNTLQQHEHITTSNIFSSPYNKDFLAADWPSVENLVIVGSGLSMVDAIEYTTQQGFSGTFTLISRHGLIPLAHGKKFGCNSGLDIPKHAKNNATKLVRFIRAKISEQEKENAEWQSIIDILRIQANEIWLELSAKEKLKLQKIQPWWNIARHRIPYNSHKKINELGQTGRLKILKCKVDTIKNELGLLYLRSKNRETILKSEKLVICTGYRNGINNLSNPLGKLLNSEKQIANDLISNKYRICTDYKIYAIGPCLSDALFETTSIHNIREQAFHIAKDIKSII